MSPQSSIRDRAKDGPNRPLQTRLTLGSRWQGPTLEEFVERVEHEFGASTDLIGILRDGVGRHDNLAPADIRELCALLGVPPEDFGV